jgi:cysteine desulfurase / selenocysteine lyase
MDIGLLRDATPACRDLIHFNNAGAALSPEPVTSALLEHLALEQRIGGYEAADAVIPALENFYHAFARLLNCKAGEIAYVENATRGWTQLLHSIPFKPGDRILTGQSEYASNYLSLLHLSRTRQVKVDVVENTPLGQISLDSLRSKIDTDVRLIALTHVPSQSGVIHPAAEVGLLARKHNILYLLDACQSAGQLAIDVQKIGCDMLTGSGRKYLRGPRGTGFLYVRNQSMELLEPAGVDLHSARWSSANDYALRDDARRFEIWEQFIAGKIALGVAADYACELGMEVIESRIRHLASLLRQHLKDIPDVTVHDRGTQLCGIVTFSVKNESATELQKKLREHRINTSVIKRQNTLLDFVKRGLEDINRASVHYYNTEEEVLRFSDTLRDVLKSD